MLNSFEFFIAILSFQRTRYKNIFNQDVIKTVTSVFMPLHKNMLS